MSFGSVMTHIRTRLRFALLRSEVTALRGVRGRKSCSGMKDLANVNFVPCHARGGVVVPMRASALGLCFLLRPPPQARRARARVRRDKGSCTIPTKTDQVDDMTNG